MKEEFVTKLERQIADLQAQYDKFNDVETVTTDMESSVL